MDYKGGQYKLDNSKKPNYKNGSLPCDAPLAMAYVPIQECIDPTYDYNEALNRGTLFPGLDLPFMNMVNTGNLTGTPLGELMALDFVAHELVLYLDTHPSDKEAFQMLQNIQKLAETAKDRFVKRYGPICHKDLAGMKEFTWLNNPWPWDYKKMEED